MNTIKPSVELWSIPFGSQDMLRHIERAGRVCYKSEDKITDDSAESFIRKIIERGHESVLEHGNIILKCNKKMYKEFRRYQKNENAMGRVVYLRFSVDYDRDDTRYIVSGNIRAWRACMRYFIDNYSLHFPWMEYFVDKAYPWAFFDLREIMFSNTTCDTSCIAVVIPYTKLIYSNEILTHTCITQTATVDRGITHELVRHRPASFSQESTRYCNYAKGKFGGEIAVIDPVFTDLDAGRIWEDACRSAEHAYNALIEKGVKPQIARSVLPTCLKAELVITANLRELLHMINLRGESGAHPQAIQWAQMTHDLLKSTYFNIHIDDYKEWVKDGY